MKKMKLINVERKETEYTFSFTEKELKVLLAVAGSTSGNQALSYLHNKYVVDELETSDYSIGDAMFIVDFWDYASSALKEKS